MAPIVHQFDWPDRFVVGTVGVPGARTFFIQARAGVQIISVSVEKEQSAALAERMEEILDELMADEDNPFGIPAMAPDELADNDPLDQPVEEQFRAGAMSLGWDPTTAQIVIEAIPLPEGDPEAFEALEVIEPEEILRVRIPVGTARAFARRTREVLGAGRPLCPLCGVAMDSDDHVCTLPDGFR